LRFINLWLKLQKRRKRRRKKKIKTRRRKKTAKTRKRRKTLPIKVYYRICTLRHIRIEKIHGSQNVFGIKY
jgi:hypothetical protein